MAAPMRWLLPEIDPAPVDSLVCSLRIRPPAARVLVSRGYRDPDPARQFLRPRLDDLHDPLLLAGMPAAVERLRRAIAGREKILLYGDYDVDGTTSIVILKKAIELAGGSACFHVPHRLRDGYGMRSEVIEQAAADGVTLIISLDTGIRAAEVVRHAGELGIDVIVTDHHLPDAGLPPAFAILNPNQPTCRYPEKNLCGAGVAFKLVQALLGSLGWPEDRLRKVVESFLKLVAIATVADVVPLTGENRVLVKYGLAGLRSIRNPGLRALLKVAGFAEGEIPSAAQVAFRVAPRLNAAGRMADANDIVNLLLVQDAAEARSLAERLHALNLERQQTESEIIDAILEECSRVPVTDEQAALVFLGKSWHRGVLGIVANRLVERFHRPVIVLSEEANDGLAQGSGRSIAEFHLLASLESMDGLFTRFGGHRLAVGLALPIVRVCEFRERLNAYAAARLSPASFQPELEIDAPVEFGEITGQAVADVLSLAPFGFGNPPPLFVARGVEVAGEPVIWRDRHVRVNLRQNGRTLLFTAWGFAGRIGELRSGARLDAALAFEEDSFSRSRGYPGWCVVLRDVRPAE